MTKQNPRVWRTIRVVVDVPVRGEVREKDIVREVQTALSTGHIMSDSCFKEVAFGRIRAKAYSKVKAHEDAKEERFLNRERAAGKWV